MEKIFMIDRPFVVKITKANVSEISVIEKQENLTCYRISITKDKPHENATLKISWKQKMLDGYSVWTPLCGRNRSMLQWEAVKSDSDFFRGAPVLSLLSNDESNNTTVAISDNVAHCRISFGIDDFPQNDEYSFSVDISIPPSDTAEYDTILRIDNRKKSLADCLYEVANWWKMQCGLKNDIPASAENAVYSTWYNFHQTPNQKLLEEELIVAEEIGLKTVILDDGWQFDGEGVGDYSLCGDWKISKEKFPDFKAFVSKIHNKDMRIMLWFCVPFVGVKTEDYKKFNGKFLYFSEKEQAGILDIRYPSVREHIVGTYRKFIERYGIDGLKLDFIDSFKDGDDIPPYSPEMDSKTVGKAVKKLLNEINQLKEIKKDLLIEFRQYYVGAEIVSHCNMLRVMDCAYDSVTNRIGIADLRMLDPYTAIHSDMLLWAKTEKAELCARQLLNIMFGVPQISVLLTKVDPLHIIVLKEYLSYWTKNRDVLLHGRLSVKQPEANYSQISSEKDGRKITVLYSENYYEFTYKDEDVFNATSDEYTVINSPCDIEIKVFDCLGKQIREERIGKGVYKLLVPKCGRICLKTVKQ